MKFLFDFFPIILFYIAYKLTNNNIFIATGAAIVATFLQVGGYWMKHKRVETMHLVTLVLLVVLGGATILLHDPLFIKWKVTIVNWLFGLAFLGSQFVGEKNLVERMMSATITVPKYVWSRLNFSWVVFFVTMGFANMYVFMKFDEATWVDFKVYGLLGLTFVFVIGQAFYLTRHIEPTDDSEKEH